jgi:hypothetical protein
MSGNLGSISSIRTCIVRLSAYLVHELFLEGQSSFGTVHDGRKLPDVERRVYSLLQTSASMNLYLMHSTYHSKSLHLRKSATIDRTCRWVLTVLGLGLGNAIVALDQSECWF